MPELELDPNEARVLGVLVEKELTTPDQYPLTLNATTLGANQKSNRDPVLELSEGDVYAALQKLIRKGLVGSIHPVGARVEKFGHNGAAILGVSSTELAVLAELLMRGPQQPGELRARAARMTPIESLPALSELLKTLIEKGFVVRLDPTPGSRAERYAQTLAAGSHAFRASPISAPPAAIAGGAAVARQAPLTAAMTKDEGETLEKRLVELEFNVGRLRRQLDNLAWKLGEKLEG